MRSRPPQAAVGAILAGGRGRRIGGAKPTVELAGRPLLEHALAAVRGARLEPIVIAKPDTELPVLDCEIVLEPQQPMHPACGIVTALRRCAGRPLVAVACDMPFLVPSLLAWLAATSESLVLPESGGSLQPFPGRYDASLLGRLERAMVSGEPLRDCLAALGARRIGPAELARFGSVDRLAFNVNTPAELEQAERMLSEQG
jgi:molybdopterin-guanine dinucleotide biosynthesis protein A